MKPIDARGTVCRRLLAAVVIVSGSGAEAVLGQEPAVKLGPNSADEPVAQAYSKEKAAEFLDGVAVSWTRQRKCGTCHTNYNYMLARPALGDSSNPAMGEIRAFFEGRVAHWDDKEAGAKPRWDTEVVATAVALACNDAATSGRLHPLTRRALDKMWTLQREDGTWDWLKCNWPPYEHDDYYGATFAALGVGVAPDDYRQTEPARRGLEKLQEFFRKNPPPSLHHRAMLLWASIRLEGLMTPSQREKTIKDLLALQHRDGGWNLPSLGDWKRHDGTDNDKNGPSDGFGTGFVVYVLRQAGLDAENPAIRRGVEWLRANQRVSGRWFTRSVSSDKAHYITNAGSGFAVMALKACEPVEPSAR
jgi:squalene-hopene/tetraprenyl-beta-curcumene cyclase